MKLSLCIFVDCFPISARADGGDIAADEVATRRLQNFGVGDKRRELERAADRCGAECFGEKIFGECFEAADVVFIGDQEQIARGRLGVLVELVGVNVAYKLLEDIRAKVLDDNALVFRLLHVGGEQLAKNGRASRKKKLRSLQNEIRKKLSIENWRFTLSSRFSSGKAIMQSSNSPSVYTLTRSLQSWQLSVRRFASVRSAIVNSSVAQYGRL